MFRSVIIGIGKLTLGNEQPQSAILTIIVKEGTLPWSCNGYISSISVQEYAYTHIYIYIYICVCVCV
jgi:hypothetical protein